MRACCHDAGQIDPRTVERYHATDRLERHPGSLQPLRIGADQPDKLRAGAVPDQDHAMHVEPEATRSAAEPRNRPRDVRRLNLDLNSRHEPIVHGRPGVTLRGEMGRLAAAMVVPRSRRPAPAMNEQNERRRLRLTRH